MEAEMKVKSYETLQTWITRKKGNKSFLNKQKQPPEVFCKKRCSKKFRKIHRKTPVAESLFKRDPGTGVFL